MEGILYLVIGVTFFICFMCFFFFGIFSKVNSLIYLLDYNLLFWGGVDLSYESLFDWMSFIFGGVVFLISSSVLIYSKDYSGGDKTSGRFISLMILFVLSMLFMVSSGGLVSMMLGWDGLGVISYVLVIYYQSSSSYKSGMITIMTNRFGDVLIILSITLLLGSGGWSFGMIFGSEVELMLVVAACTKSAQVPFSAWLPEASAAPTPVSCLVHSSTLVTAGVFMLVRLEGMVGSSFLGSSLLMSVSLITSLVAGSSASLEVDGKKVVAMSTLSQLGLMMFMMSSGLWKLTYFHMIMHAFFKALMFMGVGGVLWSGSGNQDIRCMGGGYKGLWVINQGLLVSVLCLVGFPFFCGFFSKDLLLEVYVMLEGGLIEKVMFLVGFSLSVLYGVRLFIMLMVKSGEEKVYGHFSGGSYISFGIFVLMMVSLGGGSVYSWLEDLYEGVELELGGKVLGLVMMMVGISFMMSWLDVGDSMISRSGVKGSLVFLGGGSNLGVLSGVWGYKLLSDGNYGDDDQTWVEEGGGGGVYVWSGSFIEFFNLKMMDFFLLMLFMMMMVVMFI